MFCVKRLTCAFAALARMNDSAPAQIFFKNGAFDESATLETADALVSGFGAQISVYWNAHLQQYCMLSAGNTIQIRTSKTLWGPWSKATDVFDVPSELAGDGLIYCAYFHPELWQNNGQTMVFTYCITDGNGDGLPYMVEISLLPK
jgi:hypothetical protein